MITGLKNGIPILRFAAPALFIALAAISQIEAAAEKPSVKLADDPRYIQALRALDEGIPQVSIEKLTECLAAKPSPDDRALATFQLARAFLAAGRGEDALKALSRLPSTYDARAGLLKAQTFAALGRCGDAYPIYQQLAMQPGAPPACRIGEAECLHALGRTPEAIRLLEPVAGGNQAAVAIRLRLADYYIEEGEIGKCETIFNAVQPRSPAESKGKKYIEGRLLLAKREYGQALLVFHDVLNKPEGLSENVMVGATLGMADARLALEGPEIADSVIEQFIGHNPDIAGMEILFRRLDQIYAVEKTPSESELQKWAGERPPGARSALATYYLARAYDRDHKADQAIGTLKFFISANPDHPLVPEAWLLQGKILLDRQDMEAAVKAFEAAMQHAPDKGFLAEAEMSCANTYFEQGEFGQAQGMYRDAAKHSERLWPQAVFNSALSWLNQANYDKFWADYQELSTRYPKSEMLSELVLEEGLLQARSSDPRAEGTLRGFVRDFPQHPRVAEARLALAEMAYLKPFPDLDMAAGYLKASNESPQTTDTSERAEYLGIFLADAAGDRDEDKVIGACQAFIRNHPTSPLLANVYMKLGQVYFRRGEWLNAETQFERLEHEIPTSPLAEAALFLAGQAALKTMNTDKALDNFNKVVKRNGPLKLYARQQQAIIDSSEHEEDAIKLYDEILGSKPDAELKFASLGGKADLCFLLGIKDPKYFDQAIATYNDLAKLPDVTSYWRNQALYGKGRCYEKLDRPDEALASFYDVIQPPASRKNGPEYLWYYKAGFEAAQILEDRKQWKAAIAIYKKMAAFVGPRSDQAKERLTRLRMEHFIWDE